MEYSWRKMIRRAVDETPSPVKMRLPRKRVDLTAAHSPGSMNPARPLEMIAQLLINAGTTLAKANYRSRRLRGYVLPEDAKRMVEETKKR